jgi:hypothetical protein
MEKGALFAEKNRPRKAQNASAADTSEGAISFSPRALS